MTEPTADQHLVIRGLRVAPVTDPEREILQGIDLTVGNMGRADLFALMETPPELMGLLGPVKLLWAMRRVLRYFGGAGLSHRYVSAYCEGSVATRLLANFPAPHRADSQTFSALDTRTLSIVPRRG